MATAGSAIPESVLASTTERVERAGDLRRRAESHIAQAAREAKRLALQALYALEADAGAPAKELAEVLLTLGAVRELLGELESAETTYRRTLAVLEAAPAAQRDAATHLRVRALARLSQVYCLQGRYGDADALATRR